MVVIRDGRRRGCRVVVLELLMAVQQLAQEFEEHASKVDLLLAVMTCLLPVVKVESRSHSVFGRGLRALKEVGREEESKLTTAVLRWERTSSLEEKLVMSILYFVPCPSRGPSARSWVVNKQSELVEIH